MNRFKKELKKRGYKTEEDYDYLPYETAPGVFIEAICIDASRARYTIYYDVIACSTQFDNQMHGHEFVPTI